MNKREVEEVLNLANMATARIEQFNEQIDMLNNAMTTVSNMFKDNDGKPSGVNKDKLLNLMARKEQVIGELQVSVLMWTNRLIYANKLIAMVGNGTIEAILTERCVFGREYSHIIKSMNYSRHRVWELYNDGLYRIASKTKGISKKDYLKAI